MRLTEAVAMSNPRKVKRIAFIKNALDLIWVLSVFLFAARAYIYFQVELGHKENWKFLYDYVPNFIACGIAFLLSFAINPLIFREYDLSNVPDYLKKELAKIDRIIENKRVKGDDLSVIWESYLGGDSLTVFAKTTAGNFTVIVFHVSYEGFLHLKEIELILDKELAELWLKKQLKNKPAEYELVLGEKLSLA